MSKFSPSDIEQALSKVIHPEINYSLVDLGMIKNVICEEEKIGLTLKLPFLGIPIKELLIQRVKGALANLDKSLQVEINEEEMSQEEREKFIRMAREGWKF
jgi:metal-sulfur cluster biosynthetic enzyme